MSISGSSALWVVTVPGFEKEGCFPLWVFKTFIKAVNMFCKMQNNFSLVFIFWHTEARKISGKWDNLRSTRMQSKIGLLLKNLVTTLPKMQLGQWNHRRIIIRLHAASSGATQGFIVLSSHRVTLNMTCKHTWMCKIVVADLFWGGYLHSTAFLRQILYFSLPTFI